jgi:hypothetical protein
MVRLQKTQDPRLGRAEPRKLIMKALNHFDKILGELILASREKAADLDEEEELVLKHGVVFDMLQPVSESEETAALNELILPWIAEIPEEEMLREHASFFAMIESRQEKYRYGQYKPRLARNGLMPSAYRDDIRGAFATWVANKNEAIAEAKKRPR